MTKDFYSLGLIGHPLAHSISPTIHLAALQALNLSGEYKLYPVYPLPRGEPRLKQLIESVRYGKITGMNVTVPHKESLLPWLDELTATAKAIGAANTIYLENGKVTGDNTDASGFLNDIKSSSLWMKNGSALILGAGGAARAVCYALAQSGWRIRVASRRVPQAERLVKDIARSLFTKEYPMNSLELNSAAIQPILESCDLIINTTSVGMSPKDNFSPWPSDLLLPSYAKVYDLVYSPTETAFLKQAHAAGCQIRNGLGMLVEQAALAFKLWTGLIASKDAMFEAASHSL